MNKVFVLFLLMLTFFIGCSDNPTFDNGGDGGGVIYSLVESEPSINISRNIILINAFDPTNSEEGGIYSASISNPIRVLEVHNSDLRFPVMIRSDLFACLDANSINLYHIGDSTEISTIPGNFTSLAVLNDSLLAASSNVGLYFINIQTGLAKLISLSYDPMCYTKDTITCLSFIQPNMNIITKLTFDIFDNDTDSVLIASAVPIDTVYSTTPIHWASVEPLGNRYCYVKDNSVYSGSSGSTNINAVANITRLHPLIIDYNMIIYPGEDGRLYQTDFEGNNHTPWWGAAQ